MPNGTVYVSSGVVSTLLEITTLESPVQDGSAAVILAGGTAIETQLGAGGTQTVYGVASNTNITGVEYVESGGITYNSNDVGQQIVNSGGDRRAAASPT